jgi:hypothetical protein
MCFFEHVADLRSDVDRASRGKSSFARECLRQSFTFDKLHHDEVTSVRQVARIEDHRGVRMMELGHGPRFAQKSIGNVSIAGELAFDDLYCYRSFQTQVCGEIDSAHATGSDLTFDPEPAGDKLGDIHI